MPSGNGCSAVFPTVPNTQLLGPPVLHSSVQREEGVLPFLLISAQRSHCPWGCSLLSQAHAGCLPLAHASFLLAATVASAVVSRERGEVSFSMSDSSTEAAQLVKWDFIPHLQSPAWSVSAGRRAANQSPKQGVLGTGKHTLWFPLSQELSHWCGALSLPLGVVLHGGLDGWEP